MQWSILSSLFWLLATSSAHYLEDDNYNPLNKTLWRRVRGPGGDGGGGQAPGASELFLIGDSSLKGGCASQVDVIDEWVIEARLLNEAAITAYSGYKTKNAYAVLLNQFFGFGVIVTPNPDGSNTYSMAIRTQYEAKRWKSIGDRLARVSEFLAGAGLRDSPVPGEAPRIFCSADAAQLVNDGDITMDNNGDRVVKARDPITNEPTEYLSIQDTFNYEGGNIFWISAFNGYTNLKKYSDSDTKACPETGGIRYAATNRGTTSKIIEPDFELGKCNRLIMFCPASFGGVGDVHNYPSLAQAVAIDNYPSATAGKGGTKTLDNLGLDKIVPRSATLYHELIHLTDNGPGDTEDPWYNLGRILYVAKKALATPEDDDDDDDELDFTLLPKNPETYVFFAMAAYMTINAPEGASPVTYVGGYPWKVSELPV